MNFQDAQKETKTITVKSLHAAIHGTITPKMDYCLPKGMIIPPKKDHLCTFLPIVASCQYALLERKKLLLDANLRDKGATQSIQNYL